MQHSCFNVMFHMFQLNAIVCFTCDYECKIMLMRMICNAKCMRNTGMLHILRLMIAKRPMKLSHKLNALLRE
jgi:hypothetical protein